MKNLLPFLVVGVVTGSLYGMAAVGLVLTYRTSGVFNFAHGALSAAAAYLFYWLHVDQAWSWPFAAFVSVFVFGILSGLILEQVTRRLIGAPEAVVVVATVGLLLAIVGGLYVIFGSVQKNFPQFLPTGSIKTAGVAITYAQIISISLTVACVFGLYIFLRVTRLGVAMRAVVDNPALLALAGTRPVRVRSTAWIIGSTFAALSGILIAPTPGRNAILLTLLVVQAFGACAIGGFVSLPLTYLGGILVGVVSSVATKYWGATPPWNGIPVSVPFLVLVGVLMVIPTRKLPSAKAAVRTLASTRTILPRRALQILAVAGIAWMLVLPSVVGPKLAVWLGALPMVIMFASLALLVWTSGQISLCHPAFAAVGATTVSHLTMKAGLPWGLALVLAGLTAVPLGALVAIPAIRLSGVYLALATFGFAILTQSVLYPSALMFKNQALLQVSRPDLGIFDTASDRGLYYLMLAITAACCAVLAVLSRSRLGRLLRGMSETPTMLSTHGLQVNVTRLLVFCVSAFFAAVAGGLVITQTSAINPDTYQPFQALVWLAVLSICGTRLIGSSILAAAVLMIVPAYLPGFTADQQTLVFGVVAVAAVLLLANRDRISTMLARSAAAADWRRAASPFRYRLGAFAPEGPEIDLATNGVKVRQGGSR
jgi:branched-subunit amino acid ABC-type transport system permease component